MEFQHTGPLSNNAARESVREAAHEPIAVVGIGCRFPGGAAGPDRYWQLLHDGVDAITETPPSRWNLERFYFPDAVRPGKTQSRWGGYVEQLERFDPQLFGISPKEAACMDPQQRMLMEVAWRALEDGGQPLGQIAGRPVAVFVGISSFDYAVGSLSFQDRGCIGPYTNTGGSSSIAANRISYCFDLRGPSVAVDTACSSSLVALHLACESLRRGESEMALCGGVNALLLPDFYVGFSQLGVLSPDGRCKTFDARANGYVRSEGAGMVLLKPLQQAVRDNDLIYCVIRGTAINQDGHTVGLTVPSGDAQQKLVRVACEAAGVEPAEIQYVETHGTGTPVGDPIEARALGAALSTNRDAAQPCLIGSVKTNIGHLEAGAGIASLIKVALSLHHEKIAPHLHLQTPHPDIDLETWKLRIPLTAEPWPASGARRLAGINGFGYGGANAHVVVEEAPRHSALIVPPARDGEVAAESLLLPLSARSPEALQATAAQLADWLEQLPADVSLRDLAASAAHRYSHLEYRTAVWGASVSDWVNRLQEPAARLPGSSSSPSSATNAALPSAPQSEAANLDAGLLFICCGQGAQWWGMGREWLASNASFRDAIRRCQQEFDKYVDWSIEEELLRDESTSRMHETSIAQPALFALQVGLASSWEAVGIRPTAYVGHSVGEIAAAYLAGGLSFSDACLVAIERGRTMDLASSSGAMLAAGISEDEARHRIGALNVNVSMAAVNGPSSVTLSGPSEAVEALARSLETDGVFCKRLAVEYAFHSQQMEPVRDALLQSLAKIQPRPTKIDLLSTVTGELIAGERLDASYWWRNVRKGVRFADAMREAAERGFEVAVEIGPHPVLTYAINECFHAAGKRVRVVPSLRRDQPDSARFHESLAWLYRLGAEIDWRGLYQPPAQFIRLPPYPFQQQTLWVESHESKASRLSVSHPLLGESVDRHCPTWHSRLDLNLQTSLRDHRVRGNCVLPAAAMIESALAAARQLETTSTATLGRFRFLRPCVLSDGNALRLETAYDAERRQLRMAWRETDDDAWQSLAVVEVMHDDIAGTPMAGSPTEVRSRCTEWFDAERCYAFCERLGLAYGAEYRGLVGGWRRDGEAFAEVHLDTLTDDVGYQAGIHPALLDSCFHAMIVADKSFDHSLDGLYLPAEIERIDFLQSPGSKLQVHARLRQKSKQRLIADVDILNAQGELCMRLRGFVSHRAGRGSEEESVHDWLYSYRWVPAEIAHDDSVTAAKQVDRVCFLFADRGTLAERLGESLRRLGDRVIRIDHGLLFEAVAPDHFVLDPESKGDFERLFREAIPDDPDTEIHNIYLWGIDTPNVPQLNCELLQHSTLLTTVAPLHLVQAWDAIAENRTAQLTVLTTGAQSRDESLEPVAVAQGPLIGLTRVIISEFAAFQTKLVDLPADAEPQPTDAALLKPLLAELRDAGDHEDELMLRKEQRFARRFAPHFDQPLPLDPKTAIQSRLCIGTTYGIDDLQYRSQTAPLLGPHEVEIEVAAAGLNFSDVMKVLHLYPGLADGPVPLGAECSGRITRVGSEVTMWQVDQEVIAVAPGSFASHVVANADLVAAKPSCLTHEQAAAIPVAFLTAAHALEDCARLRTGESVLIHSASGGVGLAAMQLAHRLGAKIYATAGSEEKRAFVKRLGAERVMDSRSLAFADQVMSATAGAGVDAVLNSLPGEALARGLATLKLGGRFLEIGKRDIYDDNPLGMFPFRNNLAFFAIDLDQLFKAQAAAMGQKLREIAADLEHGRLEPLPIETWNVEETDGAFRFMQQAKHIGKVTVRYQQPPSRVYPGDFGQMRFRADGTYWIVGGLGGFGLQIARWLGQRGAGTLVLSGRQGTVTEAAAEVLAELKLLGTDVHVVPADVTQPADVERVLQSIDERLPKLRGVIHSAMVLEDRLLADLDRDTLDRVLRPKVLGGWNLHAATVDRALDHFILFSSLSSVFGHAGQANYSAANALLDSLAAYRRSQGLPGCVVNWGHLGEVGYLAEREELGQRLERQGVLSFSVQQATQSLEHILQSHAVQTSVLRMDWSLWRGLGVTGEVSPRFAHLLRSGDNEAIEVASADQIREASSGQRQQLVDDLLRQKAASLLGFAQGQLDGRRSLLELGLDSLMAVELRNWIESQIQVALPVSELMRDTNLEQLTAKVCTSIADENAPGNVPREETFTPEESSARLDSSTAKDLLQTLPDLPPDEVTAILAQLLREQGTTADDAT